jgi:hypothetical protein
MFDGHVRPMQQFVRADVLKVTDWQHEPTWPHPSWIVQHAVMVGQLVV